jgi:hypothetical protein
MFDCLYRASIEAQVKRAFRDSSIDVNVFDKHRLILDSISPDATIIVRRHHLVRG